MTIEIRWDDDARTRVLWRYNPGWTWQDFHTAACELDELIANSARAVDIIFDTGRTQPPLSGILFSEWNQALALFRSRIGIMVVCNGIPFAQKVASVYGQLLAPRGLTLVTTPTVADARHLIAQRRNTPAALSNTG